MSIYPELRAQPASPPCRLPGHGAPSHSIARLAHTSAANDGSHRDAQRGAVEQQLREHILGDGFPCVAARSAFNRSNYRFGVFNRMGSGHTTRLLHSSLLDFSQEFEVLGSDLVSYIAVFDDAPSADEKQFETAFWRQLQSLHEFDAPRHAWAGGVNTDPQSNAFSFSVGGRAFFIVGMHPAASRLSRRTPLTMIVFNFHEQFEQLRASGKYEGMQAAIRRRDIALQGSINPVLARFGESSEARQYAGRAVPEDWKCPFHVVQEQGA